MSVLLGIDPGKSTGWCFITDKGVVDCGVWTCDPYSSTVFDHPTYQPDKLIMEHPQIYRPTESQGDPNDLAGMIFQVGRFAQYYAMTYRTDFKVIEPAQWKRQLPKDICASRVWELLNPNEQTAVSRCGRGLSKKALLDMMDAVGIALFGAGRKLFP